MARLSVDIFRVSTKIIQRDLLVDVDQLRIYALYWKICAKLAYENGLSFWHR